MHNLLSHWQSTSTAFHTGRRQQAQTTLQTLRSQSPPFLRALLHPNLHALQPQSPPPLLNLPNNAPLPLHMLVIEANLTALYNYALSKRTAPTTALKLIQQGITLLATNSQINNTPYDQLLNALLTIPDNRNPVERESILRFLAAALSAYELCIAVWLETANISEASDAAIVYNSLRRLFESMGGVDDSQGETGRLLEGCLCAVAGDWEGGIRALKGGGGGVREMYLAAVLMIRRGGMAERAVQLLETCVGKGYRGTDAMALLARVKGGVEIWRGVIGMGMERRVGSLWCAAREMGRRGLYVGQAGVLECLLEVMRGEVACWRGVRVGGVDGTVERGMVMGALVRALCGAGEWEKARKWVAECQGEGTGGVGVAADAAWVEVVGGDVELGLTLAKGACEVGMRESGLLAKGEGLVRLGRLEEAEKVLVEACKGVVGGRGGEVVRGVCFHNLAVVRHCLQREGADEGFAAAQSAFKKMGVGLELGASFARCLVMFAGGRMEDGAGHWMAQRESEGVSGETQNEQNGGDDTERKVWKADTNVMTEVPEWMLKRMDQVCVKLMRRAVAKRKLTDMMEQVEAEWAESQGNGGGE